MFDRDKMKYQDLKKCTDEQFRRIVGVTRSTFNQMLEELIAVQPTFGRPPKLCLEDRLLLTLSYCREYRRFLQTGAQFGVSEATAYRIVRTIEHDLLKSERFHLPKRVKSEELTMDEIEWVIIDSTEIQIERPQKNRNVSIVERKRSTP